MKPTKIRAAALVLAASTPAAAAIHQVPSGLATLTEAIAAASPGDSIVVAAGTYSPSANGETFPLLVATDALTILGAGMGLSVLDADGASRGLLWDAASGGRVSGFTIRGGVADFGGGMRIQNGDPEIDHNLFTENSASLRGSGIHVMKPALPVSSPWIHHNVVWENFDTNPTDADDPHGVVISGQVQGVFEHNLVGRTDGNGLLVGGVASPSVRHNILFENGLPGPEPRGRGICWIGGAPALIFHNLFHANVVAALLWSSSGGDFSGEEANDVSPSDAVYGNLDGDPLFVDVDAGDFHLEAGSPAIDAGDPSLPLDPDGTIADLGPFFFEQSGVGVPGTGGAGTLAGLASAPNPFRATTTVRFDLAREARVTVEIVDVAGRLVRRWADASFGAGRRTVSWDGRDEDGRAVASGVYLIMVRAGDEAWSAPVVRLR
ncbi:MAG: FlgD immunoglobulin-like domain containing protein [bacterium]